MQLAAQEAWENKQVYKFDENGNTQESMSHVIINRVKDHNSIGTVIIWSPPDALYPNFQ